VRTDDGSVAVGAGGKHVVHAPGRGARAAERPASADAFYLLAPAPPSATPRRELLTGPAAVLALVGHLRLGALLGGAERARLMATLGEITRAAPVYALHVPRDFAVLPAVVEQLIAWHGGARPPARTPASA
jgi:hypothetical protein